MSAVVATGWDMYSPRSTIKRVAAEAIGVGECCYILNTDGLAYLCDAGENNKCHGVALNAVAAGEYVTLVTEGRLRVQTSQTIGNRAFSGNIAGGTAPTTTLATGVVVGMAIEEFLVLVRIMPSLNTDW